MWGPDHVDTSDSAIAEGVDAAAAAAGGDSSGGLGGSGSGVGGGGGGAVDPALSLLILRFATMIVQKVCACVWWLGEGGGFLGLLLLLLLLLLLWGMVVLISVLYSCSVKGQQLPNYRNDNRAGGGTEEISVEAPKLPTCSNKLGRTLLPEEGVRTGPCKYSTGAVRAYTPESTRRHVALYWSACRLERALAVCGPSRIFFATLYFFLVVWRHGFPHFPSKSSVVRCSKCRH